MTFFSQACRICGSNFEVTLGYAARIFLPRAIYENIDIVFIEFYGIH
jgi:hypothetical protein